MNALRFTWSILSALLVFGSCKEKEDSLNGMNCLSAKVLTPWCDNTSVVQILTPDQNVGEVWKDVREVNVFFENVVHVAYISPVDFPEGTIFHFRYDSLGPFYGPPVCKIGGDPKKKIQIVMVVNSCL